MMDGMGWGDRKAKFYAQGEKEKVGNLNFRQVSQFKFGGQIASWSSTQLRLRTKIGSRGPVRSAKIRLRGIFWTFGSCALTSTWFLMSATK